MCFEIDACLDTNDIVIISLQFNQSMNNNGFQITREKTYKMKINYFLGTTLYNFATAYFTSFS